MSRTTLSKVIAAAVFAAAPGIANAAARAELRPGGDLTVGSPAQLVVTVDHDAGQPPAIQVPGASIQYSGQMSQTKSVNGKTSHESSFVYTVVPRRIGTLDVPAINVGGEQSAPIHATVVRSASPATPSAPTASSGPTPNTSSISGARGASAQAFLRIDMPRRQLVVGESVPVKIRAYFRAGVSATLQGNPHAASPAYTLSQLSDKPVQTQVEVQGVPYLQATWTAVVSAARPTSDKMTIEVPVEIAYREQPAARPRPSSPPQQQRPRRSVRDLFGDLDAFGGGADLDSFFNDPFFDQTTDPFADFDSMFDVGPVRQENVTLRATGGRVPVADLPEAGKPNGFTGAVGAFALAVEPPATPLRVGEPASLTFRVTGRGNFDRVSGVELAGSADWKAYPAKAGFEATGGADPTAGTKTFTQTIVPVHAGTFATPAVTFAYFDPAANAYRSVSTQPIQLSVEPAAGGGVASTSPAPPTASGPVFDNTRHATLVPWIRQRAFWWWPGLIGAATALLVGAGWSRRSDWTRRFARKRAVDRRVATELARVSAATRTRDPAAFFEAARRAFQLRLAATWGVPPETITTSDIAVRLGDDARPIREIFEQADGVTYAHGLATPAALEHWRAVIDDQLANLEASR